MKNVRFKILILAMALVVVTQVGNLATILLTAKRDVSTQAQTSLHKGGATIREVMRRRTDRLVKDADLLAADIGFRQAVGAQDARTIAASLAKYSRLGDADIAILLDADGQVLASTLYDRL